NTASRQILLDLRLARSRAITERLNHRLVFVPASETYRRQRRPEGTYEDEGPPVTLPAGIDLVDCNATVKAITFAPRGTASTFGTITLRAPNGDQRRIITDMVGRVRVQ